MSCASHEASHTAQGTTKRMRVRQQLTQLVTCSEASLRGKWTLHRMWGSCVSHPVFSKVILFPEEEGNNSIEEFPSTPMALRARPSAQGCLQQRAILSGRLPGSNFPCKPGTHLWYSSVSPWAPMLTVALVRGLARRQLPLPKGRAEEEDST